MRTLFTALVAAVAMTGLAAAQTPAPPGAPQPYTGEVISVSYLEFAGPQIAGGRTALTELRKKILKEPGNSGDRVFVEIGQPQRFVVIESWARAEAQGARMKGAADLLTTDWRKHGALAPADVRLHKPYNVAPAKAFGPSTIYVVTHVDVGPPGLPGLEAILKPLAEKTRLENGLLQFDILQTTARTNHFSLIEAWASPAALQAHAVAAHSLEFREKLNPLLGALYDQRFYKLAP